MRPSKHSLGVALGVVAVVTLVVGLVVYEYRSPTGFYAREHADIRNIEQPIESPYTDLDGAPVELRTFSGSPIVINAWASWSPFSATDLPLLSELAEQYEGKVKVIAMNRMEDRERAKAYLVTIGTPQGILYLVDPTDHFYTTIEGFAMPETVLYDRVGNIVLHKRGVLTKEELTIEIEKLLLED